MIISDKGTAQSFADAFSDECSRKIIVSTNLRPKSIEEISEEQLIPLSTCYRRVISLVECGIMKAIDPNESGDRKWRNKRHECYMTSFSNMTIRIEKDSLVVEIDAFSPQVASKMSPLLLAESPTN
jgi:hypothetical protein